MGSPHLSVRDLVTRAGWSGGAQPCQPYDVRPLHLHWGLLPPRERVEEAIARVLGSAFRQATTGRGVSAVCQPRGTD